MGSLWRAPEGQIAKFSWFLLALAHGAKVKLGGAVGVARKGPKGGISGNARNVTKPVQNDEFRCRGGLPRVGFVDFSLVLCVKVTFWKSHLGGPELEGDQGPKVVNYTMSKKL